MMDQEAAGRPLPKLPPYTSPLTPLIFGSRYLIWGSVTCSRTRSPKYPVTPRLRGCRVHPPLVLF